MHVSGFGSFLPFGEIPPGTLFLDQSPSAIGGDTAILLKVVDPGQRLNCIRIFDRGLIEKGCDMPSAATRLSPEKRVLALADFFVEIENGIDNVVWGTDLDFTRASVLSDGKGELAVKAYRNQHPGDYEFLLFHLGTGDLAGPGSASVGFRRWSILRRGSQGERVEIYRFDT